MKSFKQFINEKFDFSSIRSKYSINTDGDNRIDIFNDAGAVGYIEWEKDGGEVAKIFVGTPYRLKGVGRYLWDLATEWSEENDSDLPEHSSSRTKDGDEFAKSIGGYIPRLRDDIDGWASRE